MAEAAATPALSTNEAGLQYVEVSHSSGSRIKVFLFGAHVTSFVSPAGQELLFMSSRAVMDGSKPIRGGIPIAFPQFAAQGPLPMHGLVRTRVWELVRVDNGVIVLKLSSNADTLASWPHAFQLEYVVSFDGHSLTASLHIVNPADAPGPFGFEALLHTYVRVGVPGADAAPLSGVRITGCQGMRYISKPEGGAVKDETDASIAFAGEVDRVYMHSDGAAQDVVVSGITTPTADGSPGFTQVTIHRSGAVRDEAPRVRMGALHAPVDVVIWNAGAARCAAIPDFGPEDYLLYVCVEPGRVSPATKDFLHHRALAPGKRYTLQQVLTWAA